VSNQTVLAALAIRKIPGMTNLREIVMERHSELPSELVPPLPIKFRSVRNG
jgi:hypothetical protein